MVLILNIITINTIDMITILQYDYDITIDMIMFYYRYDYVLLFLFCSSFLK